MKDWKEKFRLYASKFCYDWTGDGQELEDYLSKLIEQVEKEAYVGGCVDGQGLHGALEGIVIETSETIKKKAKIEVLMELLSSASGGGSWRRIATLLILKLEKE